MPLFALYQRRQSSLVEPYLEDLREKGVTCLVDPVNEESDSPETISVNLVDRLRDSSHLLLFVPDEAPPPWWVGFALGAAVSQDRRIVTCKLDRPPLPRFLVKWPCLEGCDGFTRFVECYRRDASVPFRESKNTFHPIKTSEQFHRKLREQLR